MDPEENRAGVRSGKGGPSGLRTRAESGQGVQRACPLAQGSGDGASPQDLAVGHRGAAKWAVTGRQVRVPRYPESFRGVTAPWRGS
jgi:hypothetical protein